MDDQYRTSSPDLSTFQPPSSKHDRPYQPYTPNHIPSIQSTAPYPIQHQHPYQPHSHPTQYQQQQQPLFTQTQNHPDYSAPQYSPPIPALPPQHTFQQSTHLPPSYSPTEAYGVKPEYTPPPTDLTSRSAYDHHIHPSHPSNMLRAPRVKGEDSTSLGAAPAYRNPNPNNIEIKTKFPVARIKRIMQADEEVGKVAQVTPVAVNKALELFMIALVTGAADKAREKGGKRVTAQHLKMVVEGDEQFDFLGDIVKRVADVQEGAGGEGKKRKEKVNSSDSDGEEKKVKKGRGRKKKSDD